MHQTTYEIYISDTLHFMAQGKATDKRFVDFIKPSEETNETAEEIAQRVIANAGLNLKGDDEE